MKKTKIYDIAHLKNHEIIYNEPRNNEEIPDKNSF